MSPWHHGGWQVMRLALKDAPGRCEDVNPVIQGPGKVTGSYITQRMKLMKINGTFLT